MAPVAYMAAIFLLSSIPDTENPTNALESVLRWATPELQNLLHLPLFGGLAWCWYWGLDPWARQQWSRVGIALAATVSYGILDEVHQLSVPGRFGSLTDAALNAVGAVLAIAWVVRRTQRLERPLSP